MRRRTLITLAIVAVLAAVFVWVRGRPSGETASAVVPAATAPSSSTDDPEGSQPTSANSELSREHVEGSAENPSDATKPREHSASTIRGLVVDLDHRAIDAALVRLLRRTSDEFASLDPGVPVNELARATTSPRGEFSFEVELDRIYRLEASAPARAPAMLGGLRAGDEVELVLTVGATVLGGVTRIGDGSQVIDALVELRPRSSDDGPQFLAARMSARTDGSGSFLIDGVPSGPWELRVYPTGEASSFGHELDLAPGVRVRRDVVIEPGLTVRGQVRNARTGTGIENAEVGEGWTFARTVRTDAEGKYEFRGFTKAYAELHARAPGFGTVERIVAGPEEIRTEVDFELLPARRVTGRVLDAKGTPLEGIDVAAVASDEGGPDDSSRIDWRPGRTDARGEYALSGLRPEMRHSLLVRKEGFGSAVFAFPDDELEREELRLPDVELHAASKLRGIVVDESGDGFANLEVSLSGANADRFRFGAAQRDESWSIDYYAAQRETRTDAHGRFGFADVAAGSYEIRVRRPTSHESLHVSREVPQGAVIDDVRFVIERGLEIAGRVVVSDGKPVPKVYVSIDPRGDGTSADAECAPDGTFRASGLTGASYDLTAYPYVSSEDQAAGRRLLPTVLEGVSAGRTDVVLELTIAKLVRGRVADSAGAPVPAALVVALVAGAPRSEATTDAEGRFEIALAADVEVELAVGKAREPSLGYTSEELLSDPRAVRVRGVRPGGPDVAIRLDPR